MVKKSKLLAALDVHKGRNHELERQKALQKKAEKRKRMQAESKSLGDRNADKFVVKGDGSEPQVEVESAGWVSDEGGGDDGVEGGDGGSDGDVVVESGDAVKSNEVEEEGRLEAQEASKYPRPTLECSDDAGAPITGQPQSPASSGSEDEIPLSDLSSLSSTEAADIIPHQRLTINNTAALLRAHKSIALPLSTLPFSTHQSLSSPAQISIPDINDDLNRELAFYKQCLDAATEARDLLKKEGVPFSRPSDYFAEMVKSDEHMGKIKAKMVEDAAGKKAASEARRQRDLKRFGKQVQVAKLQERDRAKRDTLEKINLLKRKRKDTDTGKAGEEDLFDVALEDASAADKAAQAGKRDGRGTSRDKRQKKDAKYGFGGKKRFAKSGDAMSTGDLRGFSAKKMKGVKKGPQRLGKSRRAKL